DVATPEVGAVSRAAPDHVLGPPGVAVIALHQASAPADDLAGLATFENVALVVDDLDVGAEQRLAHRTALAALPVARLGDSDEALGDAVDLVDADMRKALAHFVERR